MSVESVSMSTSLQMDEESFTRLSTYITREYGIKLPLAKKSMLESRLNKKVRSLGLTSYKEFLDLIFAGQDDNHELRQVIDLITTNKTDFFREPGHFQFLTGQFLTPYINESNRRSLKIWSAGCSTGEEPYSIIMTLEEFRKQQPDFTYSILASDLSTRVIQAAHNGIYDIEKTAPIPLDFKRKYFLRSTSNPQLVRVKPEYRKKLQFRRINFIDDGFGLPKADLDIIFCRNVLIYFDKPTQERVILKFCSLLKPGGVLFLGHSESIMGMDLPLIQLRPTVYKLVE